MPARPHSSDYFHVFRFHVIDEGDGTLNPVAGFSACTMPEITVEAAEYKEGIWTYKRKSPGIPAFNDITLTQGIVKGRTQFWDWIKSVQKGEDYRRNITILVFHRTDVVSKDNYAQSNASFKVHLTDAFPIRVKAGLDLDGNTSDIMVSEMDLAYENAEMENPE